MSNQETNRKWQNVEHENRKWQNVEHENRESSSYSKPQRVPLAELQTDILIEPEYAAQLSQAHGARAMGNLVNFGVGESYGLIEPFLILYLSRGSSAPLAVKKTIEKVKDISDLVGDVCKLLDPSKPLTEKLITAAFDLTLKANGTDDDTIKKIKGTGNLMKKLLPIFIDMQMAWYYQKMSTSEKLTDLELDFFNLVTDQNSIIDSNKTSVWDHIDILQAMWDESEIVSIVTSMEEIMTASGNAFEYAAYAAKRVQEQLLKIDFSDNLYEMNGSEYSPYSSPYRDLSSDSVAQKMSPAEIKKALVEAKARRLEVERLQKKAGEAKRKKLEEQRLKINLYKKEYRDDTGNLIPRLNENYAKSYYKGSMFSDAYIGRVQIEIKKLEERLRVEAELLEKQAIEETNTTTNVVGQADPIPDFKMIETELIFANSAQAEEITYNSSPELVFMELTGVFDNMAELSTSTSSYPSSSTSGTSTEKKKDKKKKDRKPNLLDKIGDGLNTFNPFTIIRAKKKQALEKRLAVDEERMKEYKAHIQRSIERDPSMEYFYSAKYQEENQYMYGGGASFSNPLEANNFSSPVGGSSIGSFSDVFSNNDTPLDIPPFLTVDDVLKDPKFKQAAQNIANNETYKQLYEYNQELYKGFQEESPVSDEDRNTLDETRDFIVSLRHSADQIRQAEQHEQERRAKNPPQISKGVWW